MFHAKADCHAPPRGIGGFLKSRKPTKYTLHGYGKTMEAAVKDLEDNVRRNKATRLHKPIVKQETN